MIPNIRISDPDENGRIHFDYLGVRGSLEIPEPGWATIYTFFSQSPKRGQAAKTLELLKREFGSLSVTDIGDPGEESHQFWIHMIQKGLIEVAYDPDGNEITKNPTSTLQNP